jgi:hypothetical protein
MNSLSEATGKRLCNAIEEQNRLMKRYIDSLAYLHADLDRNKRVREVKAKNQADLDQISLESDCLFR